MGHDHKLSSKPKKLKIGPTCTALDLKLIPGGLEHPQVPGESLFGPKLKTYVEPYNGNIFDFIEKNILLTTFWN